MPTLTYLWFAAQMKLGLTPLKASHAGIMFAVEREHYQLRGMLKQRGIQSVLAQLIGLCDINTLFVDIGANVGIFSLVIAEQTGAQALAIEPVRTTFHSLVRNCSLNPSLPVTPLNLALGATSDLVEITAIPGSGINQVMSVAERQGVPRQFAIQIALDQLRLEAMGKRWKRIVIKVDVERYEFEVLRGANRLLDIDLPVALCVEVEISERQRLRNMIGGKYHEINPPASKSFNVISDADTSNVFLVNNAWRSKALR